MWMLVSWSLPCSSGDCFCWLFHLDVWSVSSSVIFRQISGFQVLGMSSEGEATQIAKLCASVAFFQQQACFDGFWCITLHSFETLSSNVSVSVWPLVTVRCVNHCSLNEVHSAGVKCASSQLLGGRENSRQPYIYDTTHSWLLEETENGKMLRSKWHF